MKRNQLISFLFLLLLSCQNPENFAKLGQGMMAGEATARSIILQARITQGDTLVNGDLPGMKGTGYFEWDTDSTFASPQRSQRIMARLENDHIVKLLVENLEPGTRYFYRLHYRAGASPDEISPTGSFRTLPGETSPEKVSMVVVTGMNYYRFHYGNYNRSEAYAGPDKELGYPALEAIRKRAPDYFIGTGDNVYFDHPDEQNFQRTQEEGKNPHPGGYQGKAVTDEAGIRRKYHEQFRQPRFVSLFREVATYWEKDDHEYRFNDADPHRDFPISHELGIRSFREQLPVVPPGGDSLSPTYRTHRINLDLQIWLLEGRDFRSDNTLPDGPEKTLWGKDQLAWLKSTLLESDATFKIVITPTPLVGPDDGYKSDNHTNPKGFLYEGDAFHNWLKENGFPNRNLYVVCGDRHWQYHAQHPLGVEEFSCGALVDNNSRPGRKAGDPESTDPEGLIRQFYLQDSPETASGGFLEITVERVENAPVVHFRFFDEKGRLQYEVEKSTEK